jgi:addiction module HigA family antidote
LPGYYIDYTLKNKMTAKKKLAPVHPGEILLKEFMKPLGLSQTRLGRDLGVSPRRINEIVHGKRSITADTALRLSRYFGKSDEFWVGLQADYDLDVASDLLADRIACEVKVFSPTEAQEILGA